MWLWKLAHAAWVAIGGVSQVARAKRHEHHQEAAAGSPLGDQAVLEVASRACRALAINVTCTGSLPAQGTGRLICVNHIGYIEIPIMRSLVAGSFVAEATLRGWPALGWVMEVFGTVFVDRQRPLQAPQVVAEVADRLGRGIDVLVFPEGTPSRGEYLQPFKTAIFEAAIRAHAAVVPVYLSVDSIDGCPAVGSIRDRVCWFRDRRGARPNLVRHLVGLAKLRSTAVSIHIGGAIHARDDRKALAAQTRAAMIELERVAQRAAPGSLVCPPHTARTDHPGTCPSSSRSDRSTSPTGGPG